MYVISLSTPLLRPEDKLPRTFAASRAAFHDQRRRPDHPDHFDRRTEQLPSRRGECLSPCCCLDTAAHRPGATSLHQATERAASHLEHPGKALHLAFSILGSSSEHVREQKNVGLQIEIAVLA
ncbi:hypothetical protein EAG_03195 [Camponotus floridanus]|uniref:Uncharacterized protein n=1 Tax=Camponotus floridanus TaxID=104421 RepID=E2AAV4_CAMFO|nr:hypothetical protein EAG_03195 [Camponotus floridanus]